MFKVALTQGMSWLLLCCGLLPFVLAAETLDDPMRPPITLSTGTKAQKSVTGYELSSIFISQGRRAAIINGRNVTVGERVDNARVLEIQSTEVVISLAGKKRILTLLPLSVKKPVEASQ